MADDLSQRGMLLLTSLADGPKHGYALVKDIEQFAGVTLGPGTLYGALADSRTPVLSKRYRRRNGDIRTRSPLKGPLR